MPSTCDCKMPRCLETLPSSWRIRADLWVSKADFVTWQARGILGWSLSLMLGDPRGSLSPHQGDDFLSTSKT